MNRPVAAGVALVLAGGMAAAAMLPSPRSEFTRPEKGLTPGVVASTSLRTVCGTATSSRRAVSDATRRAVYARYGLKPQHGARWEIDHLVPLELGGSNDIANLWPEYGLRPNPKDALENRLHALVCSHRLPLATAQSEIRTDWVAAYHRYLRR